MDLRYDAPNLTFNFSTGMPEKADRPRQPHAVLDCTPHAHPT